MSGRFYSFVILITIISMCGCFTVLRHAPVERESFLSSEITHRDACTQCHSDYSTFSYKNPYEMQLPFISSKYKNLNYYYHYPWWLEDFYYADAYEHGEPENSFPIDPRKFRNQRGFDTFSPAVRSSQPGTGFQLNKGIAKTDSVKQSTQKEIKKPRTGSNKIKSSNKTSRTKKKKN